MVPISKPTKDGFRPARCSGPSRSLKAQPFVPALLISGSPMLTLEETLVDEACDPTCYPVACNLNFSRRVRNARWQSTYQHQAPDSSRTRAKWEGAHFCAPSPERSRSSRTLIPSCFARACSIFVGRPLRRGATGGLVGTRSGAEAGTSLCSASQARTSDKSQVGRRVPGGEQAGGSLCGARDRSASIAATDLPRISDKTSTWKAGGNDWRLADSARTTWGLEVCFETRTIFPYRAPDRGRKNREVLTAYFLHRL